LPGILLDLLKIKPFLSPASSEIPEKREKEKGYWGDGMEGGF